jgi:hypothetical protein
MDDKQSNMEKGPLASKKFVAFLVLEVGLFLLMGLMIYGQDVDTLGGNVAFMVLAVTGGFVGVGYILGQSSLDRYVRVAQITMGKGPPEPEPEQPAKQTESDE